MNHMYFSTWEDLQSSCPGAAKLIARENSEQCPHAIFLEGRLSSIEPSNANEENEVELLVFFNAGTPDMVLWIWIHGTREELNDPSETYIDEYYEIPIAEAKTYHQFGCSI